MRVENYAVIPLGSNNASLLTNHVTDETRTGDNCNITPLRIQLDRVMIASATFMVNSTYYSTSGKNPLLIITKGIFSTFTREQIDFWF